MTTNYLFEIVGDSEYCGEEFFVQVERGAESLDMAWDIATENFPDEELICHGCYSDFSAEMMGLDTY